MFREAGIECRASHSGGGSSSSTGRGSRGGTFTGPTAAASAATTAVAAALSLSLALSFVRLATEFSLLSDTGPCWDIYKNFRVFVGGKAAVAVGLLLLVASIFFLFPPGSPSSVHELPG